MNLQPTETLIGARISRIATRFVFLAAACTIVAACTSYQPKGNFPGAESTPQMTHTYYSREACEAALDDMIQEVRGELLEKDRATLDRITCDENVSPIGTVINVVLAVPLVMLHAWLYSC